MMSLKDQTILIVDEDASNHDPEDDDQRVVAVVEVLVAISGQVRAGAGQFHVDSQDQVHSCMKANMKVKRFGTQQAELRHSYPGQRRGARKR